MKLHTTALILSAALLLCGCAERDNISAPGTNINSSLDFSESDISDSTSTSNSSSVSESSNISSSSGSLPEQSSDVSVESVPIEFTEEDKEVQEIIRDMADVLFTVQVWLTSGKPNVDDVKGENFFPRKRVYGVRQ